MRVQIIILLLVSSLEFCIGQNENGFSRSDFPPNFIFGAGSSAYQVEGAVNEDGRTPSIWDTYSHSGNIPNNSNADIAADQYHRYKEDVKLMKDTGLDAYRFSISWPRLIPSMILLSNSRGPVNPKGVEYYNNLINELISHGIQAHVTLFHYDLPQAIEDEYGGWLSRKIVKDFTSYVDVCFKEFGDRVFTWTTMNEANVFAWASYGMGTLPPQRCSFPFGPRNCTSGNSTTEPYIVTHNCLLAHASAARLYKNKQIPALIMQAKQHGLIGFNLFGFGFSPVKNSVEDIASTRRANDFYLGWFARPFVFGDYPESMKRNVGSRLPSFTSHEAKLVKGSCDFFGMNHYISMKVKDKPESLLIQQRDLILDMAVQYIFNWFGEGVLPAEFPITPSGMQEVLEYFKQFYGNPLMFIHENGQRLLSAPRETSMNDTSRVNYLKGYIGGLLDAARDGSNTKGYFTWSFLDSFELLDGYTSNFGLYYVDMINDPDLKRYPKLSAHWYSNFLKGGNKIIGVFTADGIRYRNTAVIMTTETGEMKISKGRQGPEAQNHVKVYVANLRVRKEVGVITKSMTGTVTLLEA
ncbi:beta-glucosidase 11-like [Papaver somniferum]|uniref:beta-glucosidase 11-like n=1 Tax=Papaver somniferum TaxID=3469 RepID=UPI000E70448F|nr:beta-glucosidase 11-like [Papaver somniferum]